MIVDAVKEVLGDDIEYLESENTYKLTFQMEVENKYIDELVIDDQELLADADLDEEIKQLLQEESQDTGDEPSSVGLCLRINQLDIQTKEPLYLVDFQKTSGKTHDFQT